MDSKDTELEDRDGKIIERDIAKAARRIRYDAETNRRQGYPG